MSDEYAGWDGPGEPAQPEEETDAAEPEQDETPEDAETSEEPEGDGSEEASEPASETLYAGKYKTPDELERAYRELERKLGQREIEERRSQEPQPADTSDVLNQILSLPATRLAEDAGPWDEWIQQNYPNYNAADPEDWREIKSEIRLYLREQQREQQAQARQLQTLDTQITNAFTAKYPNVMGNPVLEAAARAVTEGLWREVQQGVRPFEGPEAFAAQIGEALTQALAAVGPQAMGQWNAKQAVQRRSAVPPGGVTPAATPKPFDPDDYRGWNGPKR